MKRQFTRAATLVLLAAATTAFGHHSFQATFKSDETISVEGIVTDYRFKNPHVLLYVDVTNEDGSVTSWMSEGGSATSLRRRGWARDTLSNGQKVRITGNSTHDGSPMVSIETIEIIDASSNTVVATLGNPPAPGRPGAAPPGGTGMAAKPHEPAQFTKLKLDDGRVNLTGAWVQPRSGPRSGPPEELDGVPPFSEAGEAAQAKYNRADDPQVFCEPPGLVRQAGFTPHPVKITQNDDHVIIEYEEYGGRRLVYLGEVPASEGEKSHLGDSVARYDGDALIIETRNLLGNPSHPWGYQFSDQTTVVEMYTRADSKELGSIVHTETTVTDPVNLKEPWVLRRDKTFSAGYEFIENECRAPLRKRNVPAD
jgi:hypothetical protein